MKLLELTIAGGAYDRTIALENGRVQARGIRLRYLSMPIDEVFWRALRHREFDVTELSLGYYISLCAAGDDEYIAIPVFPSRSFRQGCVFVPADSERFSLDSLRGSTVGLPEYAMTACVWLRGLLSQEHGIAASEVRWRVGGIEAPGRRDRTPLPLPSDIDLEPIPPTATLNQLLADGALDAAITPRIPSAYWTGRIRRLLPDYSDHEAEYYRRTGIFPMMHLVAIRRDLYDRHPWVAPSIFDAYQEAKQLAYRWLADIDALPVSLPWFIPEWERTRQEFGPDPWADGLEPNRRGLETFCGYLAEQGLVKEVDLEGLFAPNVLDRFVI